MAVGFLHINGSGPRNALVGVFDKDENLIAETHSDERGFWSISSVEMEVGAYQLHAKMRAESGREHISNLINVNVDDPDADVEIEAETLDSATVEELLLMEVEGQERAAIRAAFTNYDVLFEQAVGCHDIDNAMLSNVLNTACRDYEAFWAEVSNERSKRAYARMVCVVAAGGELDDRDRKSIWSYYGKTEDEFGESVARALRSASAGWNSSME